MAPNGDNGEPVFVGQGDSAPEPGTSETEWAATSVPPRERLDPAALNGLVLGSMIASVLGVCVSPLLCAVGLLLGAAAYCLGERKYSHYAVILAVACVFLYYLAHMGVGCARAGRGIVERYEGNL